MNVLLIGGYGVFGSRLARLLVRDGHDLCIAGRDGGAAQRLADEIGARAAVFDRNGELSSLQDFAVVIDAAGPFHAGGEDPYRLARAAIAARVHYLDLSENAAFCEGIAALDAQAKAAGTCLLSGLSSVPALSSAAVRALAGDDAIHVIDTAILPGNRSPRGYSVMHAILSQAGQGMQLWRANRREPATGWSEPKRYALPDGLVRQGWLIEVPDTRLFPAFFGARTVVFRAGLELWIMRYGLAAFALIRRALPFPVTRPVVMLFKLAADALTPFGTGRGGMSVTVVTDGERRVWRLLAEDGDGPFIPAIPARALLRRARLPAGAGPALAVIGLSELEAAMSDLRVVTERRNTPDIPFFKRILGTDFEFLPPALQAIHRSADRAIWEGRAEVTRGTGLWSRLIARIFGFPKAGSGIPVTVRKLTTGEGEEAGEIWLRRFGSRRFRSHFAARESGLSERFGPFTFAIGLQLRDGGLDYPVTAAWLGPVRLPAALLPAGEARETADGSRCRFDVTIRAPLTHGLVVRYRGWLERCGDEGEPSDTGISEPD
ncbi:MAG: DUF4166 domain-containing protein [Salinarimonas sp.]|nr:DUF4166 domain-containing protein [Salinarimonas sp.]